MGKIAPQPWMAASETRAVMAALTTDGADVRFVGGCVRDSVLKRPVKDIDMGTPRSPEEVIRALERAGIKVIPTGLKHGTVTAVVGASHFEITTLRVDVETDGRHARVAFTDDWKEDAARRDFTINTLSCTLDGDVYDPFGGLEDLGRGRIRFVGVARERIAEDTLRLLRFFRFYGDYGRPPADPEALAACRLLAPELRRLSGERVRDEVFRILSLANCAETIALMRGEHVLEQTLPEGTLVGRLRGLVWLETRAFKRDGIAADTLRRLAALLDSEQSDADGVAWRLRLSNRDRDRLALLLNPGFDLTAKTSDHSLHRALYRIGRDRVRDLILLNWATELSIEPGGEAGRNIAWIDRLDAADRWTIPDFPLAGRDAQKLGLPRGPEIGRLLAEVEAWWEDGDFQADRDACLARLRELIGQEPDML